MHTDFAWCDTADGACIDVTINALVILKLHDLLVTFFRGYELSIFFSCHKIALLALLALRLPKVGLKV